MVEGRRTACRPSNCHQPYQGSVVYSGLWQIHNRVRDVMSQWGVAHGVCHNGKWHMVDFSTYRVRTHHGRVEKSINGHDWNV